MRGADFICMQVDYSFIYTDWYQTLFSEPAPFRWLWRWINTYVSEEEYEEKFKNNKEKYRAELLERDGDKCTICGRPLNGDYSLDHIDTTMDENGALNSDVSNLRLTHARCNSWRGVKQNRPQNKMWQKARRAIGAHHNVDHRMIGYADRVDKIQKKLSNKKKETPEEYRRRHARKPHIPDTKNTQQ